MTEREKGILLLASFGEIFLFLRRPASQRGAKGKWRNYGKNTITVGFLKTHINEENVKVCS